MTRSCTGVQFALTCSASVSRESISSIWPWKSCNFCSKRNAGHRNFRKAPAKFTSFFHIPLLSVYLAWQECEIFKFNKLILFPVGKKIQQQLPNICCALIGQFSSSVFASINVTPKSPHWAGCDKKTISHLAGSLNEHRYLERQSITFNSYEYCIIRGI